MQQLSGQDAMYIHAELDGFPQHIGGVTIYDQSALADGRVKFKDILALLQSRLHLSPIFRRKLLKVPLNLDQPYWVDDPNFNLEYHVRHLGLPKPGDWRQLCILVSRLHAMPLDRAFPLWEMYIIDGLNGIEGLPKNCFAVLTKVHHSAMDGATGNQFFQNIHDLSPDITMPDEVPPWQPQAYVSTEVYRRALANIWRKPGQIYSLARDAIPAYQRIQAGKEAEEFRNLDDKPVTRFQGKISPHRVVDACRFDFESVRKIKNACPGATINDAMLTLVAGGMRKYLEAKNELPENSLVAGCPLDIREKEDQDEPGNKVGVMTVALRTDIADPLERLAKVHIEAAQAKAYAKAMGTRIIADITDAVPPSVLSFGIRAAAATGLGEASVYTNTMVTNVIGAPVQLYFCGAPLVDSLSFGPLLPNVGLFQIIYSHVQNKVGSITLSFTACREMMPDPAFYKECMRASFDELYLAAQPSKVSKKRAGKRKTKISA